MHLFENCRTALAILSLFAIPSSMLAQSATGTGLKGTYFSNIALSGAAALSRTDATINFQWGTNPPASNVSAEQYSVRWTGTVEAPVSGAFTFFTRSDDGVRLWVNKQLLINHWTDHGAALDQSVPVQLTAGQKYDIQLEYYEKYGSATMQLYWSYPNQTQQIIPQMRLYPGDIALQAAPPVVTRVWLSDLPWINASNGDGPPQLDGSNGGSGAADSKPLTIGGKQYAYGLGVHARSEIRYALDDNYDVFRAVIGVDDEVGDQGSVVFEAWVDGKRVFQSDVIRGNMDGVAIAVPVENGRELTLIVTGGPDGAGPNDHADWADARFEGVEHVKYLSDLSWTSSTNGNGPVEKDRSNGGVAAGDGTRIQLRGQTYPKGLGVFAASQITYKLERKYELFSAILGVDDMSPGVGSVVFEVWSPTARLYSTPVMKRGDPVAHVVVTVTNVDELTLKVLDGGDGNANDMADWADAKLLPIGTDWPIPTTPNGLNADPGNGRMILTWNAALNAASYDIYRGVTAGGESASPIATGIAGTTWTNTGLTNGTAYYYKIKAVNPQGASGFSNEDSATPSPMEDPPAEPRSLTATAAEGGVKLDWQAATGAASYNVYRGAAAGQEAATPIAVNIKTTTFTNTGLTYGIPYFFKVKAVNVSGLSAFSNEVSATPRGGIPLAPTELEAAPGNNTIKLTWKASNGATSYSVYRHITGAAYTTPVASNITATTFTDSGLANGTTYFYRIKAVNAFGSSSFSNEDSAIPAIPPPLPGVPTGLSATPGDSTIKLEWSAAANAASYNLYRGTTSGGQSSNPFATGVTTASYLDKNLTNGTTYFYKIAAVNTTGMSSLSAQVSATPRSNTLPAPGNLTASPGDALVTLKWSAVNTAASYNVYRGTAAGGESATPIATGLTTTMFADTSVTNGTKFFYKVAAVNGAITSPLSNETSATPAPLLPAPATLTAAPGNGQIVLSWTAVPGAVRYSIYRGTVTNGELPAPVGYATALTFTNTGLANGTQYFYKVAAVNLNNMAGTQSDEASATPVGPPPAPTGLSPAAADKQITLTWNPVPGADSYNVYAGVAANGEGATPVAAGLTAATFVNTGLINGNVYFYKVTAVNSIGEGPRSAEVNSSPIGAPPTADPETLAAFRLLRQATWGPKPGDADRVKQIGRSAFLQEQFAAPASVYPDTLYAMSVESTQEHFMRLAITGNDQLRQRVAWALHKIWVVSAVEVDNAYAIVPYQRIFMNRAFGNYRDLMTDITLSPAMGRYLNMLNNRAQSVTGALPNENYARELMQLFTLGLVKLGPNGAPLLDAQNHTIPTYTEADVKEMARIFTGWTFGDGNPSTIPTGVAGENFLVPMEAVERFHDTGAKTVLGVDFPPAQTTRQDLDQALDLIFAHDNLPPFVSKQLIQMLVTSNPSPAYIGAVADVFRDNGSGVRGDLAAVVRAVLENTEAGLGTNTAGKLMEPALLVIAQVRGLNATVVDHPFMSDLAQEMGQRVFYPGSVFSYFSPGYRIRGTTIAGPEFQILTTVTALSRTNYTASLISGRFGADVVIDFTAFTSRASDPAALTDYCNLLFMGGQMSVEQRNEIINAIRVTPASDLMERTRTALYLTLASAQYQVDR